MRPQAGPFPLICYMRGLDLGSSKPLQGLWLCSFPQLGPNVSIGEGVTVGEGVRLRESIVLHGATLQVTNHLDTHSRAWYPRGQGEMQAMGSASRPFPPPNLILFYLAGAHMCSAQHRGLGEHRGALGPCGGHPQRPQSQ